MMKEKSSKRMIRSFLAGLLAFVLAFLPVLSNIPAMRAEAANKVWYHAETGSGNGNGHTYSQANSNSAAVLLHSTEKIPQVNGQFSGTFSVTYEKQGEAGEARLGFFYTYLDDNNFLYVGYDSSSKWFYEYKANGSGSYASIAGLPEQGDNSRTTFSVSVSREALEVTVNGVRKSLNNQDFFALAESTGENGRFGFRLGAPTSFHFTDAKLNNRALSGDWEFLANSTGQAFEEEEAVPVYAVTGHVKNAENQAVAGANVRIGFESTQTDESGNFSVEVEAGTYDVAVSAKGYVAKTVSNVAVSGDKNLGDIELQTKAAAQYEHYIQKDKIKAAVSDTFPQVMQYKLTDGGSEKTFQGQEEELSTIKINDVAITPAMGQVEIKADRAVYPMTLKSGAIDLEMTVVISVEQNDLTWKVTEIKKKDGCPKIHTIEVPNLNLITITDEQSNAQFMGANVSTNTAVSGDEEITFEKGFSAGDSSGYVYGFLSADGVSAGVWSNSERAGDKRLVRNNGVNSMSLTSAFWYYEYGDVALDADYDSPDYNKTPVSEMPCAKVCLAGDENQDGTVNWQDGAIAYRDIMNNPMGSENTKELVNYRISMNFSSQGTNPYLKTADNIKKVYLATDGLPQAVMMKGYGSEGHDSANSEYGYVSHRLGGLEDLKKLNSIAHKYNTQMGIHINATEAYPEAQTFDGKLITGPTDKNWGWLDQAIWINRSYDLGSGLRYKRLLQLYDQLNDTSLYANKWPGVAGKGEDETVADAETIARTVAEKKQTVDTNLDFMYLDVWYADSWETRKIAQQFNSLGWRFSTEFGEEGEYDSTWQHWSTEGHYGGSGKKGMNSDVMRFLRNHQKDSYVLNYPSYPGTADNPLLGGFSLTGFEGWGGSNDSFNTYMTGTFAENLPTKFLQHYLVYKWENYSEGESPVGNHEKQITLKNEEGDTVVVTRKEQQRDDKYIERIITLNGKKVLDEVKYLLPWTDSETKTEKLYHYNYEGGTTQWELQEDWAGLANVVVYKLTDVGRTEKQTVAVENGSITLTADADTPYVVLKGDEAPKTISEWSTGAYVKDTGFNSYLGTGDSGSALNPQVWSGDVNSPDVKVVRVATGNKYLSMGSKKKDLEVMTEISGLEKGKNYVAEVYVDNKSDAKAWIEVLGGTKVVSNYTLKSVAGNYTQCDAHNLRGMSGSNMQIMLVSFTAASTSATLVLRRDAGEGITYFDDIRIVQKTLNNVHEDGSFTQDFEEIVQGIYPFVYGPAQGVTDHVTHLSELHAPYTQSGWGGMVLDDVIGGKWSLKHHGNNNGLIYRTIPQNLHLEPGVTYDVTFDYQAGRDNMYYMAIGDGVNVTQTLEYLAGTAAPAAGQKSTTGKCSFTITGSGTGQSWFGLCSTSFTEIKGQEYSFGQKDFILDNLVVKPRKGEAALTIDKTAMALNGVGDTGKVTASKDVTWSSSDENIVTVDADGYVQAVGAGEAEITATSKQNSSETVKCSVTVVNGTDILLEEPFTGIVANTESPVVDQGESIELAGKAIDGDTGTNWHSKYDFAVSETNPAIVTVTLKDGIDAISGFILKQRASGSNGLVQKLQYVVGNSFDASTHTVSDITAQGDMTVAQADAASGAEVKVPFNQTVTGKYLQIRILQGGGNFAAIAELALYKTDLFDETELLSQKQSDKNEADAAVQEAGRAVDDAKKALAEAEKAVNTASSEWKKAQAAYNKAQAELELQKAELAKKKAEKAQQEAAYALAMMEAAQAADPKVKEQKQAAADAAKAELAKTKDSIAKIEDTLAKAKQNVADTKGSMEATLAKPDKPINQGNSGGNQKPTPTPTPTPQPPVQEPIKDGVIATSGNGRYQVINAKAKTARLKEVINRKKTTLSVPATVKINGVTCKVVEVGAKVMKGNKNLKKVVLGKYVTTIGKQAFINCKKLASVQLKGKALKSIKSGAFKKTSAKLKVIAKKMKKKDKAKLLKALKKAGCSKKVKVK